MKIPCLEERNALRKWRQHCHKIERGFGGICKGVNKRQLSCEFTLCGDPSKEQQPKKKQKKNNNFVLNI